jgi:hypothetical protein
MIRITSSIEKSMTGRLVRAAKIQGANVQTETAHSEDGDSGSKFVVFVDAKLVEMSVNSVVM